MTLNQVNLQKLHDEKKLNVNFKVYQHFPLNEKFNFDTAGFSLSEHKVPHPLNFLGFSFKPISSR